MTGYCGACRYWERGDCRRYPPTVVNMKIKNPKIGRYAMGPNDPKMVDYPETRWPKTSSWQGCGEFEKREE